MDDDVEALVLVAVGLDMPLQEKRGVAPAGSVLEVGRSCTLPDGAGEARGVRPAPARHSQEGRARSHRAQPG